MTQTFDGEGRVHVGTVVRSGPCTVTQVKSVEKDGYVAVQIGFGKTKRQTKAEAGHTAELGPLRTLREFRSNDVKEMADVARGQQMDVSIFAEGDKISVSGTSKGKGFQGVVKRHGFAGGPRTHGQKHSEREPGSIGATGPQRVFKGRRMGGRMGSDRVRVKSLHIIAVDPEAQTLIVSGALPGRRGTILEIRGE